MKTEKKIENRKDEKEKTLHYEGESTKNSVVCGAAGVEFALELCVGSSDAVWNALAFEGKLRDMQTVLLFLGMLTVR